MPPLNVSLKSLSTSELLLAIDTFVFLVGMLLALVSTKCGGKAKALATLIADIVCL